METDRSQRVAAVRKRYRWAMAKAAVKLLCGAVFVLLLALRLDGDGVGSGDGGNSNSNGSLPWSLVWLPWLLACPLPCLAHRHSSAPCSAWRHPLRLQHVGMTLLPSGPTHPFIGAPGREYGYFGSALTPRNHSAVTAAAMLVRTELFDELGGFDTAFARDYNDVDFCLRARARGYRVAWTPYAHFIHHEGASIVRRKSDPAEQALFLQRWGSMRDPYYSPALNPRLDRIYEAL